MHPALRKGSLFTKKHPHFFSCLYGPGDRQTDTRPYHLPRGKNESCSSMFWDVCKLSTLLAHRDVRLVDGLRWWNVWLEEVEWIGILRQHKINLCIIMATENGNGKTSNGKLCNEKTRQQKIMVRKNGNTKLLSEITKKEKDHGEKRQPEN